MNENEIQQAITEIEQLHKAIDGKQILASAIKAGHLLLTVKDSVKHGNWKQWIRDNFETVSYVSATRYMRVAEYEEMVKDCETLTGALDKIAKVRAEEKQQTAPEETETSEAESETAQDEPAAVTESEERNRLIFAQNVTGTLMLNGVNWDVNTWSLTANNRPSSNDGSNNLIITVKALRNLVSNRCFTSMTPKEETEMKVQIVLEAMLKLIIENTNKAEELEMAA